MCLRTRLEKSCTQFLPSFYLIPQSGRAGLHVCAERGHLEVAQELLEHKAYVNAKSKVNV